VKKKKKKPLSFDGCGAFSSSNSAGRQEIGKREDSQKENQSGKKIEFQALRRSCAKKEGESLARCPKKAIAAIRKERGKKGSSG